MILDVVLLGLVALTAWVLGRLRGISMGHNEALSGLVHMDDEEYRLSLKSLMELRMMHRRCRGGVCDVSGQGRPSGL